MSHRGCVQVEQHVLISKFLPIIVQEVTQYCNDWKTHLAGINQSHNLFVPRLGAENSTNSNLLLQKVALSITDL